MEKELELEKRREKSLILHYIHCKYGIKAFLVKKDYENLKRKIKKI